LINRWYSLFSASTPVDPGLPFSDLLYRLPRPCLLVDEPTHIAYYPIFVKSSKIDHMSVILNSILPVCALIGMGKLLKVLEFTDDVFLKTVDRLIYFIFFPAMLFWKIGAPSVTPVADWSLSLAAAGAVVSVSIGSLLFVKAIRMPGKKVGSFCQGCYRFNTYVGMALILTALGDQGVREFGVMIGILIPFINLMAVSTLIWFSDRHYGRREKIRILIKTSASNPLILACLAGILYAKLRIPFPVFLDNTFGLLSLVALPMALLSIGGSLEVQQLKGNLPAALTAALFKLVFLPLLGFVFLSLFQVTGIPFQVGMIFFALPTSTANYILSSQLKSDLNTASAGIVVSTLLSPLSLAVVMLLVTRP
jgi:malonate transporter and related proteins